VVKGTQTGAATDFDGKYSIKAEKGQTLVFSFVGYDEVERKVGDSNVINVTLKEGGVLETVVINAIGVEVNKVTEMGIAKNTVKAKVLETSGENDPVAALSGKVTGVKINMSSGDPGASANILIRGPKTIMLSTQPLFVVDGIPVSDGLRSSSVDGVERPSFIGGINPDDILSVKVLKGAAAAALWGSDGANGVILITTKSGKGMTKGQLRVSVNSSISFDKSLTQFPLQDKYGQGNNGTWSVNSGSWGDKISDRPGGEDDVDTTGTVFVDQDGKKWYPILTKKSTETYNEKNRNAVINNGMIIRNGAQLSAATEKARYFLSLGYLDQDGIFANSSFTRANLGFKSSMKISKKVNIKTNFKFVKITQNAIQKGSNLSGLLLGLYRTPADFDNSGYIGKKFTPGALTVFGSHRSYRKPVGTNDKQGPGYNNPLFTVYAQSNPYEQYHVISGGTFDYQLNDWIKLIARTGIDYSSYKSSSYFPINSGENAQGQYSSLLRSQYKINNDFIAQFDKKLSDNLSLNALVGLNLNHYKGEGISGYYYDFLLNTETPTASNTSSAEKRNPSFGTTIIRNSALYGSATISYKDLLYTTITSRGEVSSTYKNSAFYPSASLAFNFTNMESFKDSELLNDGVFRISYAKVGNSPDPYLIDTYYVSASDSDGWGSSWSSSSYSGAIWRDITKGNPDLRPEMTAEFEVGLSLKMLKNRLSLVTNYYNSKSTDLLLPVRQPASNGFSYQWENAAEMTNKGVEVEFSYDVIKKDNLNWKIGMNYSKNINEVTNLVGTEYIGLNGFTSTSSGVAEGYAFGILRSGDWKYNDDGSLALDSNGFPQKGDLVFAGDPNPDFLASAYTNVRYKNLKLRLLFDGSFGGESWDGTTGALTYFGRTVFTAEESIVDGNVINIDGTPVSALPYAQDNGDGTYTVRGTVKDFGGGDVLLDQSWYKGLGGGFGPVGTQFFRDATWIKLRELSLGYTLRANLLKKAKISSIDFSVIGRNLYLWTKDKDWGIDPETNLSGASKGRGLQYFNHPTTKSIIFSTKINF
jgi:TonB-linked SusC/RagA family outer membrane protein